MGQSQSEERPPVTREQLSHLLAQRFLRHSLSEIEVYSFKDNFESLAQVEDTTSPSSPATGSSTNAKNVNRKILYWTEDTLTRFLGIPDALDPVGSILYQSATYLGAFPFESALAPVVLDFEALVKVVVLLTGRGAKVIKGKAGAGAGGATGTGAEKERIDMAKLLWRSFAVWERVVEDVDEAEVVEEEEAKVEAEQEGGTSTGDEGNSKTVQVPKSGEDIFTIGGDEDDEEEDDEDPLTLAALDALDVNDVTSFAEGSNKKSESEKSNQQQDVKTNSTTKRKRKIQRAHIPIDNLRKLIMLLLLISPLEPTQPLAVFVDRCSGEGLAGLQRAAENVLNAFVNDGNDKGVGWRQFKMVMKRSTPYLFDGLSALFEHLLFSKNVNMSRPSIPSSSLPSPPDSTTSRSQSTSSDHEAPNILDLTQPLLATQGEIMTTDVISQLSMFIKGSNLWRRLRLLYAGSQAGFSMGSFETKVLKWHAPTILLVSGTRLPEGKPPRNSREKAFVDTLPSRKYPTSRRRGGRRREEKENVKDVKEEEKKKGEKGGKGGDDGDEDEEEERVVFGVYLNAPWKISHKDTFGDTSTLLFQLEPVHEVFLPSKYVKSYAHFNRTDGIAFGNSLPDHGGGHHVKKHHYGGGGGHGHVNLGPVSLTFDEGLEFAVFNHVGEGGAFYRSESRRVGGGEGDGTEDERTWQDRFRIDEIEVWGCGGDKEAEEQRRLWAWEEREALLRRSVSLGKDVEADRALLEMAGLIGGNGSRSGGSI